MSRRCSRRTVFIILFSFISFFSFALAEEKKIYDQAGKLAAIENYNKAGQKAGKFTYFDENGNKTQEITYKAGEYDGVFTEYYSNGKVAYEGSFVSGKENGVHKWFDEEGLPQSSITYKSGVKDGEALFYHANGKLAQKLLYKNDIILGLPENFKPDGDRIAHHQIAYGSHGSPETQNEKGEYNSFWYSFFQDIGFYIFGFLVILIVLFSLFFRKKLQ